MRYDHPLILLKAPDPGPRLAQTRRGNSNGCCFCFHSIVTAQVATKALSLRPGHIPTSPPRHQTGLPHSYRTWRHKAALSKTCLIVPSHSNSGMAKHSTRRTGWPDKSLFGCAPLTLECCEARICPSPTRVPRRSEVTMTSFIATVYVATPRPSHGSPRLPTAPYTERPPVNSAEAAHERGLQAYVQIGATTGGTSSARDPAASREQPATSCDNMPRPPWEAAASARS